MQNRRIKRTFYIVVIMQQIVIFQTRAATIRGMIRAKLQRLFAFKGWSVIQTLWVTVDIQKNKCKKKVEVKRVYHFPM